MPVPFDATAHRLKEGGTAGEAGAVLAIDLWDPASSGQRSVLSGPDAGSGPLFDTPMQLAYDPTSTARS